MIVLNYRREQQNFQQDMTFIHHLILHYSLEVRLKFPLEFAVE